MTISFIIHNDYFLLDITWQHVQPIKVVLMRQKSNKDQYSHGHIIFCPLLVSLSFFS